MKSLSLAIETSGRNHSVAVSAAGKIVVSQDAKSFLGETSDVDGRPEPNSSSLLMPMIRSVIQDANVEPRQIDLISVTNGPGSFTGLRVGVVTAKTLAFSLNCPLVSVNTLRASAVRAMVRNGLDQGRVVKTIINAQRGQLFAATFRVAAESAAVEGSMDCLPVTAAHIVDPNQWVSELNDGDFVTGAGVKMSAGLIETAMVQLPSLEVEKEPFRGCDVATVAAIGEQKFHEGDLASAWNLKPVYFRPSAAEEVRVAKGS